MVEIKARTPINEGRYSLKELAADPHNVGTSAQRNPVEVDSRGASRRTSGLADLPCVPHRSLAFDSAGDLFISNYSISFKSKVSVFPKSSGTVFGQAVVANTLATVIAAGCNNPADLAFDLRGNLFISTIYTNHKVLVLPRASGSIYGHSVAADTLAAVAPFPSSSPNAIAFDSAGDLFIAVGISKVFVLPRSSGRIFGHSVTANRLGTLVSAGLSVPLGISFDSAGDLFIDSVFTNTVSVLPRASGRDLRAASCRRHSRNTGLVRWHRLELVLEQF